MLRDQWHLQPAGPGLFRHHARYPACMWPHSVARSDVACLVSLVILGSVVVHPQSRPSDVIGEPEAYRIYAALFPKLWPVTTARATNLVIQAETVIKRSLTEEGSDCLPTGLPTGTPLPEEWQSATDSFKRENTRRRRLLPQFPVMVAPYRLVAEADIGSTITPPDFWRGFYARFPNSGGYYAVSAVGFNEAKTRAMVYIETHSGLLGASGQFYLLEENDGQWVQPKMRISSCMWES